MSDRIKLVVLLTLTLVFIAIFIGNGLTLDNYQYFLSRRAPKVLAIILSGIAIALSSLVFQTITHNRILTPSIMGFDALYLFVQVMIVALFGGFSIFSMNTYLNFSVSIVAMMTFSMLLFGFYFLKENRNLMMLLLLGVILGQLFSNMASFVIMLMDPNEFTIVQTKMFASFNNIKVDLVYLSAPILVIVSFLLYRMHSILDVFWLDRDNAVSLGVDVPKVTRKVLLLSAILISISTALIGPILFFGILVTNLTREWFKSYQHSTLLVACSVMSVFSLIAGQWVVERVLQFGTTLSVIINFIGGIYFLSLLIRNKVV